MSTDTGLNASPETGVSAAQPAPLRFDANLKWLFTEVPFLERFDAAAKAGFTAVEYAAPYSYDPADLKRRLADAGLKQVLVNTPMGEPGTPTRSGVACFPDRVQEFRDGVDQGLEYATALGADFLHIVGGIRPDGVSRDRAFARYVTNIAWAADRSQGTGVRLVLEAMNKRDAPGFILDTQAQAAAVAEAVGSENVGLLFDFYHAQIDEGDLLTTLDNVWDRVFHLQIADTPSRHEPGTGEIAYTRIFDHLRRRGYQGWIGCEYAPAAGTVEGLDWIKEASA
ncbi:hydroxypyruvate isomerase family protein [Arthrobacter sp. 135MFCol5.1]|uniref:hydroxypyruvate isomerase family protein n=1 Tax=Arthrobacter sp. 135MFCol5.1 TaxID=1158050 RepID=UPI0003635F7D|nr:TIM barrel protein [Arthrobacter sp. 135MFCol5.1]